MAHKRTFQPNGRPPTVAVNLLGSQIDSEWARVQAEKPQTPVKPCCYRCKTPFGHSAVAGVCCHTEGTP